MPELTIRPGHPDFLDLPWERSIVEWDVPHMVELPKGISRHEVRFFSYPETIYVVKELSERAARQDYRVLRALESFGSPAVKPVGVVEGRHPDAAAEQSAALITEYERFSFSYRELLAGAGFGPRRNQMLNAFAQLLVQLHIAGVFWGDCSLSNVLYRFDAEAIETIMVDAETAVLYTEGLLSDGRREEDLEIMIMNVAGGMADIAAAAGRAIDDADLDLGEDIARRYRALWHELTSAEIIGADERFRIESMVARLNQLGFDVEEIDLVPVDGGSSLQVTVRVGGRDFHARRLKAITGIDALEGQARQVLSDLHYFTAAESASTPTGKNLSAIMWRTTVFEALISRLAAIDGLADPIQAYCDLLHHRYVMSTGAGTDVGTEAAFEDWLARGRPGYPLD
ncbi:MAG: DUF4032 domain-containing protein [Acidimicrobiia bacterium]|nr:DUF4032 domain-containing protein [Acidimicrobiia bacterium]